MTTTKLRVEGVHKRFGDRVVLDGIDLTVDEHEVVCLIGSSGCGKSTLLRCIDLLDPIDGGRILLDDEDVTAPGSNPNAVRRRVGIVFQSFHLIPSLTAYENILIPMEILGLKDARGRAARLLEDVDLTNRGHHYPPELSGGEQQRVAIARAFANSPKYLLADEPTGNLDSKNGQHIFELMTELHRQSNVTLVLVTHDHALAARAQRQVVLKDGRVISDTLNSDGTDFAKDQTDNPDQIAE